MSLHHIANNLAAHGRNGDSMLMHVTPNEVSGLQALAQERGGSLTVNPHTGLPEANFLDDVGLGDLNKALPSIAGAGLSFFTGIDPMTAAAMVGGLAGLSSGSLSQGIMAGLGAYGGASLTGGLMGAGEAASGKAAQAAAEAADAGATGPLSGSAFSNSATLTGADRLGAGLSAAAAHPIDFLKDNKWAIAAAALPALAGTADQGSSPTALKNKGYIRRYEKNPTTGTLEQVEAVPVDDWGSRPAVEFGGVGAPVKYADGGAIGINGSDIFNAPSASIKQDPFTGGYLVYNATTKKYDRVNADGTSTPAAGLTADGAPAVSFGGVPQNKVMRDPNDTRSDSQKAYDYLMGNTGATNPMLFYHDQGAGAKPPADAVTPADLNTRTGGHYVVNKQTGTYDWVADASSGLVDLAAMQQRGGGGGGHTVSPSDGATSGRIGEMGAVASNALSNYGQIALGKLANALNLGDTASYNPSVSDARGTPVGPSPGSSGAGAVGGYGGNAQAGSAAASGAVGGYGPGTPGFGGRGDGASGGEGGDGSHGDAVGGLYSHGKFNYHPDQMYAQGGITALAGGGLGSLGGYSDGGQLLRGPGDGVSDSIPATIGQGQPARLADGEFVVPARIVSELGNGSTEAGAKQLYAMMARIQAGRAKTTGKNQVAKNSNAASHLPA